MNPVQAALEIRFDSDAGDNLSVREYLKQLLSLLWQEEERFSGKRPFGNSGWQNEIYVPLVKAGFIAGELDADGYIDGEFDYAAANQYIQTLIKAL